MNKTLKVNMGTIYNKYGLGFNSMAVVIDKEIGLIKYGEIDVVKEWYNSAIQKYTDAGYSEMVDDLILFQFDEFEQPMSIERICVFVNFMLTGTPDGHRIMSMINKSPEELGEELDRLEKIGY